MGVIVRLQARHWLLVIAILIPLTSSADLRPNTLGFYPLWENTGYVEHDSDFYVGTNSLHMSVHRKTQIGLAPLNFVYRTPNVFAKTAFFQNDKWTVASQVSFFHLMESASRGFFSPVYTSRLDNPDFNVNIATIAVAATYRLNDRVAVHQAITAMPVIASGPLTSEVNFGYSVVAELTAKQRHSVLFHLAEIGFWNHDFAVVGSSYRYQNSWFEARLGYFYRIGIDAQQSAPMISLGATL